MVRDKFLSIHAVERVLPNVCLIGSFYSTRKYVVTRATRAMYAIIKKLRELNLLIDCQLDMFDKMVVPILLYGSELWGFENLCIIEKLHLKFCKLVLSLKTSTPNVMIYGELARYPLCVKVKIRMLNFWIRLLKGKESKLSYILYSFLHSLTQINNYNFKWVECIQNILHECGLSYVWLTHNVDNEKWILNVVKQTLIDQFQQNWVSDCNASSKGLIYNLFTNNIFVSRNYINSGAYMNNITTLLRFRTSDHKLPFETGRWNNVPRNQRFCNLCKNNIGDEYHYIMICPELKEYRKAYLPSMYFRRPNAFKFFELFSCKKLAVINNLCKFINIINKRVNSPG